MSEVAWGHSQYFQGMMVGEQMLRVHFFFMLFYYLNFLFSLLRFPMSPVKIKLNQIKCKLLINVLMMNGDMSLT